MQNFNNRIYLMLTLSVKELAKLYFECVIPLLALAVYNLIGLYFNLPRVIHYPPILGGLVVLTLLFAYIHSNRLDIDWELLTAVDESPAPTKTVSTIIEQDNGTEVEELPSNEEIQMVEQEDEVFSFTDTLTEVYNKGTAKDLAHIAVHGTQMKVNNIK